MADPSLISKSKVAYAGPPTGRAKGKGFGILTFMAFLFLLIVGILYGGVYFYKQGLIKTLDGLTRELAQLEESLDKQVIDEIVRVDKGLATARLLLQRHVYSSNLFALMEEQTLQDVYYTDFTYAFSQGGTVKVSGVADGFVTLHRQLEQFRSVPLITSVELGTVQLNQDGDVTFTINIMLSENVFRFRGNQQTS